MLETLKALRLSDGFEKLKKGRKREREREPARERESQRQRERETEREREKGWTQGGFPLLAPH